jgi:hypothetical protein
MPPGHLGVEQMADGDWSEYVASAGSDPAPLAGVADDMGDALAVAQPELESIDTSTLTDQAAEGIDAATYDSGQAASWQQWSEGDLASAGSWQDQAAGDVESAQAWAAFGNMGAAQRDLDSAATASDIAADVTGVAQTDLGIGASYTDTASSDLSSALDTTTYDVGSVDTGSPDSSSD